MEKTDVLVVGSGGREHALAWRLKKSEKVGNIYVAPGNGGTAKIAENVDIKALDFPALIAFVKEKNIGLTVVGSDDPLAAGIVDEFEKEGLRVFGPSKNAARVEASKAFSKDLMKRAGIPTASYETFSDFDQAYEYVQNGKLPIVIKASGLALGKGVVICETLEEAKTALEEIMVKKIFGESGNQVVVEEYLGNDQEISIHALTDGKNAFIFPTSQDHKTIFEGDKGPNTGGMGTFAPLPWAGQEVLDWAKERVVLPALAGLAEVDSKFTGCLYPGLKLTADGPKVLEFNARFGDPETQSYMRLLKTDLFDLCNATIDGTIDQIEPSWRDGFAVTVMIASSGYPTSSSTPVEIFGVEEAENLENVVIFHSGTKLVDGKLFTAGGRVLGVSATGSSLQEAVDTAYQAVLKIKFEGMQYRKDIAAKSLNGDRPAINI